jgi:hypothetical protein
MTTPLRGEMTPFRLPLFFKYTDRVFGVGFMATISVRGRVFCRRDDSEGTWWMLGVAPGGIAAQGNSAEDAHAEFRRAYREVLYDIAEDCNQPEFDAAIKDFVETVNTSVEAEWALAVEDVRSGRTEAPPDCERLGAEQREYVHVQYTTTFAPQENTVQAKIGDAQTVHLVAA